MKKQKIELLKLAELAFDQVNESVLSEVSY